MTAMAGGDPVPNSAGSEPPRDPVGALAWDAHCHILDRRFPSRHGVTPPGMDLGSYRLLQRRIGTQRAVIVQAKHYGTDHACLLDALAQLGPDGVGIGVVRPDVEDAELIRLRGGGVRGLRFSVWNPVDTVTTVDMIEALAWRIAPLGWHVQLHMSADQIVDAAPLLDRLPCPAVIDHMGRLPPELGTQHPAFGVICRLLQAGRTWVKLSGAYLNTHAGPPDYPDAGAVARALIAAAPERLVWGSDWPHITERHKPDASQLLDLLSVWTGSTAKRDQILVKNAAELYG